jgi:hypothetical protein
VKSDKFQARKNLSLFTYSQVKLAEKSFGINFETPPNYYDVAPFFSFKDFG